MWYPTTPDVFNHNGADGGDWTLMCGSGGWNLSATDLVRVLMSLAADERLLTAAQKQTMNSECLGWDCSVRTQTDFVGKNGSWVWGAYGVQTFMGLFHQNRIAVVLLINSPPPDEITNLLAAAYATAKVPR
jgi:CubicO group peptidase (beta-lactamase class C family)